MPDSILDTTKKALGVGADYDVFDPDIIMHINSAFFTLNQIGVGPDAGYQIEGSEEQWAEFLPEGPLLGVVKSFVYASVRLAFDPPQTAHLLNAMTKVRDEQLWRINVHREGAAWATASSSTTS